jgi:5-methylcytosine-specific restriction enzyme subunit McrC
LNGDALQITPKINQINFLQMLFVCEGILRELKREFQEFVGYQRDEDAAAPQKLFARRFAADLAQIHSRSLRFKRQSANHYGYSAKGRIKIAETVLNIRSGNSRPVVSTVKVRSYDTAENRLLAAAAARARKHLDQPEWAIEWWVERFGNNRELSSDLTEVNGRLRSGYYRGSRGYYIRTLTLAKIILGQSGVMQGSFDEILGDSVLLNTATLFEDYVRRIIAQSYQEKGFIVRKGGSPAEFLYSDGSYQVSPDICIFNRVGCVMIADAKYKQPDAGDHYQMQSYIRVYGLKTGTIIYPAFEGEGVIKRRTTPDGLEVIEVGIPLSDLDATQRMLATLNEVVHFAS